MLKSPAEIMRCHSWAEPLKCPYHQTAWITLDCDGPQNPSGKGARGKDDTGQRGRRAGKHKMREHQG